MATTWIDVADSAVKIGLGAAIAGIVALLVPIVTFAKETYSDRRTRRLKLIEETIVLFNKFCSDELTFSAALTGITIAQHTGKKNEYATERYEAARKNMDSSAANFNRAIAYIELLGHHELAVQMRSVTKLHQEVNQAIRQAKNGEDVNQLFDTFKAKVRPIKASIHQEFGKIYALEPELKHLLYSSGPTI